MRMLEGHTPQAGEIAPEFTLPDSTGTLRTLTQLVSERPRVLIFYRGQW
jgi:peroxiredoxin